MPRHRVIHDSVLPTTHLPGLDAIDWTHVEAVCDAGADIPDALRRLAAVDAAGEADADEATRCKRLSTC